MKSVDKMSDGDQILYSDGHFSGDYSQELYLKRSIDDGSNRPKFYIGAYSNINGQMVRQGYIYFYLDFEMKSSSFIGIKVEPEYRNLNIASFLIASWIDLCFNNGYEFLGTNKKQRKPFLLYLLKGYGFEIFDKSLYETRPDVITVCRSIDRSDRRKFLLFRDYHHENAFKSTNVFKEDNYEIIHGFNGVIPLDQIILPLQGMKKNRISYELLDGKMAEIKTEEVLNRHKK